MTTGTPGKRHKRRKRIAAEGQAQGPVADVQAEQAEMPDLAIDAVSTMEEIEIKMVSHGPFQIRAVLTGEGGGQLAELVASIKQDGLLQPITVRLITGKDGGYEIIAGHRRFEAYKLACEGATVIKALVIDVDDEAAYRLSVIENLKRQDLNPLEEAKTFQLARDRLGWTLPQLQAATGRSIPIIEDRLELLALPDDLQTQVAAGLSPAKAMMLASLQQFSKVKGVEDPLANFDYVQAQHEWTTSQVGEAVESYFERNAYNIDKQWDPDICRRRGCLGSFGGEVCLDLEHAFQTVVLAKGPEFEKMLKEFYADPGTAKMGVTQEVGLPVFYDLGSYVPGRGGRLDLYDGEEDQDSEDYEEPEDEARGISDDGRQRLKAPKGFPLMPLPVETYSYDGREGGAFTWKTLMGHVNGDPRKKCLGCPAWKPKAKQGRALFIGRLGYSNPNPVVSLCCMVAACRTQQIAATKKEYKGPKESAQAKVKKAQQPYLRETASTLVDRLAKDRLRVLALIYLSRYSLKEMPFLDYKAKDAFAREGVKIPDHDKTPNGFLKAIMSVGEKDLVRVLASRAIYNTDGIVRSVYRGPDLYNPNPLEATARMVFGDPTGDEIKAKVKAVAAESRQPNLQKTLKKAVQKSRKPKPKAETPKKAAKASPAAKGLSNP